MIAWAAEEDELFGIPDRQAPQQHFVDEREDGGIRADPQRDRQERDRSEQRRADEAPQGVAQIASQVSHGP